MDLAPLSPAEGGLAGRSRPPAEIGRHALQLTGALALVLASAVFGVVLADNPVPTSLAIAACLGLAMLLALAVTRYETAVALGVLLLGVVAVEPAPPDAIFAVVMAVALVTGRFRIDRAPLSILALCGVYIVLNIASAVEAVDPARAGLYLAITLYLTIFAIWFTGYLDSVRKARGVVIAYLAGAVICAAISSIALFFPVPGADLLTVEGQRVKALFEDPNVYGPFLIPIALILTEEILTPRLLRMRTSTKVVLLVVLLIGLLLSYSRGAWVNFVLAAMTMLGVLVMRRGGARRAVGLLVVLVLAGVAIGAVLAVSGSLEFLEERARLQSYDSERFAAQRRGIAFGEENLLGIGPGQFEVRAPVPSHNLYVRALSEQGFLGLFAILAIILATLVLALRNAVLGRDTYGIGSAALLGAWVGIAIESFVIDSNHWRHLFVVAALIWVGARRPDEQPTPAVSRPEL
jgi:O-antigen ligase